LRDFARSGDNLYGDAERLSTNAVLDFDPFAARKIDTAYSGKFGCDVLHTESGG